ncbi:MinD/ParA family ATP-binding protein [Mycolicibacter kumamotonensis]|nr:MinD/ParA family protein [Mycolicibacter kumamotonensis]
MNADDEFLRGDFPRSDFPRGAAPQSHQQPPPHQPWGQPPPRQPAGQMPYPYPGPLPPMRPRPARGWRRVVLSATLGLVNLGPSPAEREEAAYEAAIRSMPNGIYKVGVLGKGGVGKTTVAASVGSVFAALRRADHVVAVDADTAFGRLGSRIDPRATSSYWDLAADQSMQSFADISSRVGANAAGLYVLIGEPAAGGRRVLDAALYREAALRLDRHFTISIVDCGSTMDSAVTQEALRDLDALIVVSSPWADGAGAAAKTMEWLADRGQGGLLQRSVVVLNDSDGHADKRTRSALTAQFLQHGQEVVEVPFDPHLRPGGVIDVVSEMAPATRRRFLQIAAIVARHFSARPGGRTARRGPNQSM